MAVVEVVVVVVVILILNKSTYICREREKKEERIPCKIDELGVLAREISGKN